MFTILALSCLLGLDAPAPIEDAPKPLFATAEEFRDLKSEVAALKSELATLRANCKCNAASQAKATLNLSGNPVTVTVDPQPFRPLHAAGAIATAPVKAAANAVRTVCSGGQCRVVESSGVQAEFSGVPGSSEITVYSPPLSVGFGGQVYQGGCSGGSCGVQRSGLFGRRR